MEICCIKDNLKWRVSPTAWSSAVMSLHWPSPATNIYHANIEPLFIGSTIYYHLLPFITITCYPDKCPMVSSDVQPAALSLPSYQIISCYKLSWDKLSWHCPHIGCLLLGPSNDRNYTSNFSRLTTFTTPYHNFQDSSSDQCRTSDKYVGGKFKHCNNMNDNLW